MTKFRGGWFGCGLAFGLATLGFQPFARAVPNVSPVVQQTYPHDPQAFTQGLLFSGGQLYESTGLYGHSSLRRVELNSGTVKQVVSLGATEFGEGLALVDNRLVQLTWKSGVAHVYDLDSFALQKSFDYSGEGWGLCYDGQRLVMSDGTSSLFFRNPTTFEMTGSVAVTRDGSSVRQLNELECVNGWVYANIWQTKQIVKIDPATGNVAATITVDGLLTTDEAANADVLNGIAYLPDNGRFYITGKLWPKLFEVDFPTAAAPEPAPSPESPASPGVSTDPSTKPSSSAGETSSGAPQSGAASTPPKLPSGCHCATAGASGASASGAGAGGASASSERRWALGGLALAIPLVGLGRRARRRAGVARSKR